MVVDGTAVAGCWPRKALGECLNLIRNGLSRTQNKESKGLPVSRIETISRDKIDPAKVGYLDNLTEAEVAEYSLLPGDVLFSHINSEPQLGRTALYQGEPPVLIHGMNLLVLRASDALDASFLHFQCAHLRETAAFVALAGRAVGQSSINQGRLKTLEISLPPKKEQRRIAALLSTVQRAVEHQEKLIALTAELKNALMWKLFTEGTRGEPRKKTEIGLIPDSWRSTQLGELLSKTQYGLSLRAGESGTFPVLRMTNQVDGRIVPNELKYVNLGPKDAAAFRCAPGDILFNRTNSFDLVGRTAIFDLKGDYVFASYLIRLQTNVTRMLPLFLNHYLNWEATQARLKSIASRAVSQSNISATRLKGFQVPQPSLSEQAEIVEHVNLCDAKREQHRRKLRATHDLFRTLLHDLMTAQLRVDQVDMSELEALGIKVD